MIQSAVDFLNRIPNSGPAVKNGIQKAVDVTNEVAQSAHQMTQETNAVVESVELAVAEGVANYPKIIDNLNSTLIRLEWALSIVYYVTLGLMLICIFQCAFSVWTSWMHIYAAKKVDIVEGNIPIGI